MVSVRAEGGTCCKTSSTRTSRVWTASDQYWVDLGNARAGADKSSRGFESGMIQNSQYIVLCRLIAHLEQSKAVEISDKQIVCWEDEMRAHDMCSSLVEGVIAQSPKRKGSNVPEALRASGCSQVIRNA